jgi:hypothetical protein
MRESIIHISRLLSGHEKCPNGHYLYRTYYYNMIDLLYVRTPIKTYDFPLPFRGQFVINEILWDVWESANKQFVALTCSGVSHDINYNILHERQVRYVEKLDNYLILEDVTYDYITENYSLVRVGRDNYYLFVRSTDNYFYLGRLALKLVRKALSLQLASQEVITNICTLDKYNEMHFVTPFKVRPLLQALAQKNVTKFNDIAADYCTRLTKYFMIFKTQPVVKHNLNLIISAYTSRDFIKYTCKENVKFDGSSLCFNTDRGLLRKYYTIDFTYTDARRLAYIMQSCPVRYDNKVITFDQYIQICNI